MEISVTLKIRKKEKANKTALLFGLNISLRENGIGLLVSARYRDE